MLDVAQASAQTEILQDAQAAGQQAVAPEFPLEGRALLEHADGHSRARQQEPKRETARTRPHDENAAVHSKRWPHQHGDTLIHLED